MIGSFFPALAARNRVDNEQKIIIFFSSKRSSRTFSLVGEVLFQGALV
jgi:hypothetical protein